MSWWCHRSQCPLDGEGGADVRAEGPHLPRKPREHREPPGGLHCRRWEAFPLLDRLSSSLRTFWLQLTVVWTLKPCCVCTCSLYMYWLILFYGNRYCLERLCWLAAAPSKCRPLIRNQILGSQYRPASTWKRDAVWLVTNLPCSWSIICTWLALSMDYKTAFRLDSTQVGTSELLGKETQIFVLGLGVQNTNFVYWHQFVQCVSPQTYWYQL